ncbi:MAG TPA: nucleotidyltransferase family protein [Bacteroidales bacterium]|jgi:NDP-sugar pyrophosphorylase family protein|nr:nucleotidyltransferase family protein [Bacteroidales bacterium]
MKAMILAAGKGTRMLPLTEKMPKALIEIQGVPLIAHTILYLKYYGITDIIINVHHHASQIIDFIRNNKSFGLNIEFSDESDLLLDTGGGLYKARHFFNPDEPFVLTSSDVITDLNLKNMVDAHNLKNPLATLAVKYRKSSRDFLFDEDYGLCGWHNNVTGESRTIKEVKDPVKIAFSTIHIINPELFDLTIERGRFSIIDLYLRLALNHYITGYEHNESAWFECGRFENLEQLNKMKEIGAIYKIYH